MKRILIIVIFILMIFTSSSFAFLLFKKGAVDTSRRVFYFTGYSIYQWSGYKTEFENKYNLIYKYNLEKAEKTTFFSGNCFFSDISISPNNNHIGVLCVPKEKHRMLLIFNLKGEKILELPEFVQEYVWHPNGNKIIYMTGKTTYHGDDKVVISTGIWIYDLIGKTKIKIADKGWNIRSVSFDKHIYFWNGEKTVRYNIDTQKIEETDIKEKVEYSPDRRYYIYYLSAEVPNVWEAPYWSQFRIFDIKENKVLPPKKIGFISARDPLDIVWGKDSKKIAFRGNVTRTNYKQMLYIYDLEANQIIKRFEGRIVGYNEDRTVLVIYRDGKFFLEKIPVAKSFR